MIILNKLLQFIKWLAKLFIFECKHCGSHDSKIVGYQERERIVCAKCGK